MEPVTVFLAKALICFAGNCYPALVGNNTPTGEFQLIERRVLTPGYGGDVLQFDYDEDRNFVWAIHRVWRGSPMQYRDRRLETETPADNWITNGCINVKPDVYEALKDCCSNSILTIKE